VVRVMELQETGWTYVKPWPRQIVIPELPQLEGTQLCRGSDSDAKAHL
jgi:hypothetical protein